MDIKSNVGCWIRPTRINAEALIQILFISDTLSVYQSAQLSQTIDFIDESINGLEKFPEAS